MTTQPSTSDLAHLQDLVPGLRLFETAAGTSLAVVDDTTDGRVELRLDGADGHPGFRLEVELGNAAGYWQPGGRQGRALPPDWLVTTTSLVRSAPAGALHDAAGAVVLGWAVSEPVAELTVRCGVSEEHKTFVVDVRPSRRLDRPLILLLDTTAGALSEVAGSLARWVSAAIPGTPRRPGPATRTPVFSTWYAFTHDLDHDRVLAEATAAADVGCGAVFVDDGWQRHAHGRGYQACGDWVADEDKFPDLRATVDALHSLDLAVGLWIAPLMLGPGCDTFETWRELAPAWAHDQGCFVLDPRHASVRRYAADTCLRLVETYDVDLLKIDFLDLAMLHHGTASQGDVDDLGQAMDALLSETRRRLDEAGRGDVAFEFRQPYVNPAIARHGEILRANDCPGDSVLNRTSTLDARLFSVGQVVHSDPLLWGPEASVEAVCQQIYAAWLSVPQVSMRLSELHPDQRDALRLLLATWEAHRAVSLDGVLTVAGSELGYTQVTASRPDLGTTVLASFSPTVADLPDRPGEQVLLLNATPHRGVVVRLPRPLASGITRGADQRRLADLHPVEAGLTELDVPGWGTASLVLG